MADPANSAVLVAGMEAARAGVKWWHNPHPSGGRHAYIWDQGHTAVRTLPKPRKTAHKG